MGSATGKSCTVDSASLSSRRQLACDAINTTQQGRYPAHDDAVTFAATVSTFDNAQSHVTAF